MAKKSTMEKWKRDQERVARFREYRLELKEKIRNPKTSDEERFEAQRQLAKIKKSALPVRMRNRCLLTGRSRGVYKKFGLSRIKFRELAHQGALPGVSKASW